jgi:hypothetical protein
MHKVEAVPCDESDLYQQWSHNAQGKIESKAEPGKVLDDYQCDSGDGNPLALFTDDQGKGTCQGKNQIWSHSSDGQIVNEATGKCIDVFNFHGPDVVTYTCKSSGAQDTGNQNFTLEAWGGIRSHPTSKSDSMCLTAKPSLTSSCYNIWGRTLANGDSVLAFVNNLATPQNVTCDHTCFESLNISSTVTQVHVEDLWKHTTVETLTSPFSFTSSVDANGAASAFRISPV